MVCQIWWVPWLEPLCPLAPIDDARAAVGGEDMFAFAGPWKGKEYMNYIYGGAIQPYYNKTWLDEAGVEFPPSWDEYIPISQQLTDVANNKWATVMKLGGEHIFNAEFLMWYLNTGDDFVDADNVLIFNNENGTTALEFMKEQEDAGITLPGSLENTQSNGRTGFAAETVAWQTWQGPWEPAVIKGQGIEFDWAQALVPESPMGSRQGNAQGTGLALNKNAGSIEWATEWLMYMTAGQGNLNWHLVSSMFPVYKPVMEKIVAHYPELQMVVEQAKVGTVGIPPFVGWEELVIAMRTHFHAFWLGDKSAEAAVNDTVEEWAAAIARE